MTSDIDVGAQQLPVHQLTDLVGTRLGSNPVEIDISPNGFSTKLSSYFVTLTLENGEQPVLFVKKVHGESGSRLPNPIDREAKVYEAFGTDPEFTAPNLVGIIGNEDPYLVLEAVPGSDLRYQDLDSWALAAGELGRLHAAFAARADELESLDFLDRQNAAHNLALARGALSVLSDGHAPEAGLIERVVDGYERIATELAEEPTTLVHGDLAPKNIVFDERSGRGALFVDWEWAGIGPGLGDLADLVNGLDGAATQRMLDAYVAAAAPLVAPKQGPALDRSFKLALLHKEMFRLGRSIDWGVTDEQIAVWARTASGLFAELK